MASSANVGVGTQKFGAVQAPKCKVCNKSVYSNEKIEYDGMIWHDTCFKCQSCRSIVIVKNVAMISGDLYCKTCFKKIFTKGGKYSDFAKQENTLTTASSSSTNMSMIATAPASSTVFEATPSSSSSSTTTTPTSTSTSTSSATSSSTSSSTSTSTSTPGRLKAPTRGRSPSQTPRAVSPATRLPPSTPSTSSSSSSTSSTTPSSSSSSNPEDSGLIASLRSEIANLLAERATNESKLAEAVKSSKQFQAELQRLQSSASLVADLRSRAELAESEMGVVLSRCRDLESKMKAAEEETEGWKEEVEKRMEDYERQLAEAREKLKEKEQQKPASIPVPASAPVPMRKKKDSIELIMNPLADIMANDDENSLARSLGLNESKSNDGDSNYDKATSSSSSTYGVGVVRDEGLSRRLASVEEALAEQQADMAIMKQLFSRMKDAFDLKAD